MGRGRVRQWGGAEGKSRRKGKMGEGWKGESM